MYLRSFFLLLLPLFLLGAEMHFSDPKPTFDHPRKWLIRLNTADKHVVDHTLGAIYNVLKIYPSDSLEVCVVAYSSGMRALKKDYDPKLLSKIKSLMDYGVEFVGCLNTMQTMHWKKSDFIDGLEFVQAGIAEVIERKVAGWIEVTPYDQ